MRDLGGLFSHPLVQAGAGILAASGRGVPAGQAIGQGLLSAQQQISHQQEQEALQEYRRQQSQYQQGLLEQKRQAALSRMNMPGKPYKVQQGSEAVYMRDLPTGGTEIVGRGPYWNPSRQPQVSIDMGGLLGDLQQPIDKTEARQLRKEARGLENLVKAADRLTQHVDENPGSAGFIAEGKRVLGSFLEQTGDFLDWDWAAETGGDLAGNLAVFKARGQAFVNASKSILMAGEGRLSDQDRVRLENAAQALASLTTDREVLAVVNDLRDYTIQRAETLGISIGKESGAGFYTDPSVPPPE